MDATPESHIDFKSVTEAISHIKSIEDLIEKNESEEKDKKQKEEGEKQDGDLKMVQDLPQVRNSSGQIFQRENNSAYLF